MSYTIMDCAESLERVGIARLDVAAVVAAWGHGDGQGEDAGHYRYAEDGASEWSGGFLLHLRDGRYAYVTGWCDYTGWGCQDGAEVLHFDARPEIGALNVPSEYIRERTPPPLEWDTEPADLNRWLARGDES